MALRKFFLLCATIALAACQRTAPPAAAADQRPLILVSIAPYKFMAERIAGQGFRIETVAPLGADPHSYEPTARQVAMIGTGAVWFVIGEPFEKKILSVLKTRNSSLVEADLRQGIELLYDPSFKCSHCAADHRDRHLWLSPKTVAIQAHMIAAVLCERFPEQRELFLENERLLRDELEQLDGELSALLAPVRDRVLLVSHPAFGYFCRDYELKQLSIEFEGKEPRPKHLESVLEQAIAQHAELALALPQHNNKGAQIIAEKLRVPVRMINPYSADYFETMRFLGHIVADPQYQREQ